MNADRITHLLHFVEEQPHEPFNVYALAMEYLTDNPGQALHYFEKLLTEHPQYLPTYYHAAAVYAQLGDRPKAEMLYDIGLQLARQQNNQKTYDELNRALQQFRDEDEE